MRRSARHFVGHRVRIVGDHPYRGASGTIVAEQIVGGGPMFEVDLDDRQGCFADRVNLRLLDRNEDPHA